MSKKSKAIAISIATLCICVSIVVGCTYALFSKENTVNNHLEAGSLTIGLERTSYQEYGLKADGTMEEGVVDSSVVDLVANADKLFSINKVVPTAWKKATIKVSNAGDVAFDYGMKILWNTDGKAKDNEIKLAEQLTITVSVNGEVVKSFKLSKASENAVDLGYILKGGAAQSFEVKALFEDDIDNNLTQGVTLDFDVQVYATQKVKVA